MRSIFYVTTCTVLASFGAAQELIQISVNTQFESPDRDSYDLSVSADGRYFAFASDAANLAGGDSNNSIDVFRRDRVFCITNRVSLSSTGSEGNGESYWPSISATGRYVVFASDASNLVVNDANAYRDVFVHDTQTALTSLVSITPSGVQGNGESVSPDISSDGRYVSFTTKATNLVVDTSSMWDVVLLDRSTGALTCVSAGLSGQDANGDSVSRSISDDGRFVAFDSSASNLVVGDVNQTADVFLFDVQTSSVRAVTVDPNSVIGNAASNQSQVSRNGDWVVFSSSASNLVANDTNAVADIFRWRRQTGSFLRISRGAGGSEANGGSGESYIASDGTRIAYRSYATNLVIGDTNNYVRVHGLNPGKSSTFPRQLPLIGAQNRLFEPDTREMLGVFDASPRERLHNYDDVFLYDVASGMTTRVSTKASGAEALLPSYHARISSDGETVGFLSLDQLLATDTHYGGDIYAFADRCTGANTYCTAKVNSSGCVPFICSAGMPTVSDPDDFYLTAFRVLNQKSGMFFWGNSPIVAPLGGGTRCVAAPVVRTAVLNSGGNTTVSDCSGTYAFALTHAYMASHGMTAGTHVYGQFWSRDPFFAQPNNVGLTDGVEFVIAP